jgi:hypothetical protein
VSEELAVGLAGGFNCVLVGGGLEVDGREEVVDVEKVRGGGMLVGKGSVVSCATDDAGRIKDRKSRVEENARLDLGHRRTILGRREFMSDRIPEREDRIQDRSKRIMC